MAAEPYIIAEIASAHEGDPGLAKKLFDLASATGADAVKFQIFRRDMLMSRFHPKYESFGVIEIAPERWLDILRFRPRGRVDVVVEVFDEASLEIAEASDVVKAYKLPTSDIGNLSFLSKVAATGRQVYLGVGGATHSEVVAAVRHLYPAQTRDLILLHGFQSYPTQLADCHLSRLAALAAEFGLPVGYADHVDADDRELARVVPAMALAAGAQVIEKHITDDRSRKGRDHFSALNPDEFVDFVTFLKRVSKAIGSPELSLTEAETNYRWQMKRQAVAAGNLPAGAVFGPGDAVYKRTNREGLSGDAIAAWAGRRLKVAKAVDEPLTEEDFK